MVLHLVASYKSQLIFWYIIKRCHDEKFMTDT